MLRKTDLMGMANSTEIRSPFLDYELVDNVSKFLIHLNLIKI
jgi:hypothetical protein